MNNFIKGMPIDIICFMHEQDHSQHLNFRLLWLVSEPCIHVNTLLWVNTVIKNLYTRRWPWWTCVLTDFHGRACRDCCMSGRHHHRQAVNSLDKGNPSWVIFGSVCTSQNSEQTKHSRFAQWHLRDMDLVKTSWFPQSCLTR